MNHESFRELIALHLYGEVEGEERARLERHLEECGACRSYAREMVEGLGRIAADAGHVSGELPLDWSERLHAAVLEEPRVARMHPSWPWWTAAAGFAAGVVAAGMIGRGKPVSPAIERTQTTWERFYTEAPPPLATTESQLARIGQYVRR